MRPSGSNLASRLCGLLLVSIFAAGTAHAAVGDLDPTFGRGGPLASRVRLALLGAQPSHGAARFALELPHASDAELAVFDLSGARGCTIARGPYDAGRHLLDWDGRDAGGRAVAPGVYFVRVLVAGEQQVARIVRLGP